MKRNQSPYFMTARFAGKCAETGRDIAKGQECAYYPASRKVYHVDSKQAAELRGMQFSASCGMADANW